MYSRCTLVPPPLDAFVSTGGDEAGEAAPATGMSAVPSPSLGWTPPPDPPPYALFATWDLASKAEVLPEKAWASSKERDGDT